MPSIQEYNKTRLCYDRICLSEDVGAVAIRELILDLQSGDLPQMSNLVINNWTSRVLRMETSWISYFL